MTYGLPTNAAINYGQLGFPGWVDDLCRQWGIHSSTYPGHQANNRKDIGAAPNPQLLNRGIDWAGNPDTLLRFARWLVSTAPVRRAGVYGPEGVEMVIYEHPTTGERVWYPTWVDYSSNFSGHRDHVHLRVSGALIGTAPSDNAATVLAEATGIPADRAVRVLPQVRDGLAASECTNTNRVAMWLAQIGHESGGFVYTEEIQKDGRYAPYIGRTWIQITWEANYRAFSQWCFNRRLIPTDRFFVDHPAELADQKWAGLGAAWYWTVARPTINDMCDRRDLLGVTKAINGGTNGFTDRQTRYERALAMGDRLLTLVSPTTTEDELSAEAERQIDAMYHALMDSMRSQSPLRHLEGHGWTIPQLVRNIDGSLHIVIVELLARLGDPSSLGLLADIANADPARYPDRQQDRVLAATILDRIMTGQPTLTTAPAVSVAVTETARAAAQSAVAATTAVTEPHSTGQVVGAAFDALAALNLSGALPDEDAATLTALLDVLKSYPKAGAK